MGANQGVRTSSSCLSSMARAFTIGPRSLSTDEDILVNLKSLGLKEERSVEGAKEVKNSRWVSRLDRHILWRGREIKMDSGSEENVMGKCNAERISMVGGIRENMDNRVNDGRIMQGARQSKRYGDNQCGGWKDRVGGMTEEMKTHSNGPSN